MISKRHRLIEKIFGKSPARREPVTHDYTAKKRTIGHDYTFDPIDGGQRADAMGWGPLGMDVLESGVGRIEPGDFIIFTRGGGRTGETETTRYRFETVRYFSDPRDMWAATLVFDPRPGRERGAE